MVILNHHSKEFLIPVKVISLILCHEDYIDGNSIPNSLKSGHFTYHLHHQRGSDASATNV